MNKKIYIILLLLFLSLFFLVGCQNSNTENNYSTNRTTYETQPEPVEEELYTFSTPIKSEDPNRLTNLKITSSKINGTIVKAKKEYRGSKKAYCRKYRGAFGYRSDGNCCIASERGRNGMRFGRHYENTDPYFKPASGFAAKTAGCILRQAGRFAY